MKHITSILFFILLSCLPGWSRTYDEVRVSLLTVEPRPNKIYTVYGHTALRVTDASANRDIVFNWGTFNFNKPNFLWLFMQGKTDYFLDTDNYESFYFSYAMGNSTVVEQELNLSENEKKKLMQLLSINLHPDNRTYRYNFLFDNCTTRVRDLIAASCNSQPLFPLKEAHTTFRELIHSCTAPYPWMSFGIDLIIGSGADSLIHYQEEMFLPEKLMEAMDRTSLVVSRKTVMESDNVQAPPIHFWDKPLIVGFIIFFLYLGLTLYSVRQKKGMRIARIALFTIAGCGGILVAFLCFFSTHPCTSPNWNILWLHPLHFIGLVSCFFKKSYPFFYWYHGANFVLLCGLLLAWFLIPQELPTAAIPYVLTLALASGFSAYKLKK